MESFGSLIEEFQRQHPIVMEQDEIELISRTIRESASNSMMVEWGSGASTIKWLQEMGDNQKLISIEHNRQWFSRVGPIIGSSGNLSRKFAYHLCEANRYWVHGYGSPAEENPVGLDQYFAPNDKIFDADIFLIDGVARGVCAAMLLFRARKANPIIYLHDWYPRQSWYSWAIRLFPKVERVATTLVRLYK